MARDHQLSIRARLTLIFVFAIAVILTFTGVALVNLVHRSLLNQASNQIDAVMEQTQERFATATVSSKRVLVLATVGDVVVQVTNTSDTKVWAASSGTEATLPELSSGEVSTITTTRGPGLIFGFVYGGAIGHSVRVLLVSLLISVPLLLLMSGGLIWRGIGLRLAPVES